MNATVRAAHRRRQLDKARQSASRPLAIWPPTGRRKGRLDKVLPARWQGEWGGTTWAFSKNLCTEACGCGFCASTRVQLPRATHPLLGLWFRRAAGAKVRVTRAPALPGAGPDGVPAALRHAVRGGRADHRAAFGVIEGTPHRSLYLPRRPAGKRINLQAAAFAPPVAPCFCRAVVSRELLDLQP